MLAQHPRMRVALAVEQQCRVYPVLLPESWAEGGEATRRRRRRYPVVSALTVAALAVLPFIAYVAAVSNAAHIGYQILHLSQDIAVLESDHERLQATASSLRAPSRIERLAALRLGLRSPGPRQIAAIHLPHVAAQAAAGPGDDGSRSEDRRTGFWQRLGTYFTRSEAQAAPAPR
jgi:cell division protein FtsL